MVGFMLPIENLFNQKMQKTMFCSTFTFPVIGHYIFMKKRKFYFITVLIVYFYYLVNFILRHICQRKIV